MPHRTITALEGFVRPHVAVGKSRVETLCLLLVGMVHARTVNLGHVACARGGSVQRASTCRRLLRLFQHVRLGEDWALPLLVGLIGPARRWTLALDRTNWSIGSREVNHLVLAVVTRRFRVPLLWTVLPGKGASSMAARIALLKRYLAHFPAATIPVLLADREFVGAEWLEFLDDNNIPFAIRLRENMRVVTEDGSELTLLARVTGRQRTRSFRGRLWSAREDGALLDFAAKRLPEGWLVVVSNLPPRRALDAYRRRRDPLRPCLAQAPPAPCRFPPARILPGQGGPARAGRPAPQAQGGHVRQVLQTAGGVGSHAAARRASFFCSLRSSMLRWRLASSQFSRVSTARARTRRRRLAALGKIRTTWVRRLTSSSRRSSMLALSRCL